MLARTNDIATMADPISMMQAYVLTRWGCTRCGIFERGTQAHGNPSTRCPQCGQESDLQNSVRGMTMVPLPFCSKVRRETDQDSRYSDMTSDNRRHEFTQRRVGRANGKSTGRPRKALIPTLVAP